ncbi:hypothetical protein M0L20_13530 [Spirosoma sp. RP8]|uniref:DUF2461 domain-containing protein n=1 Tax=Spirosoma liriopis TaxID=2937440 RepID=A0ABT0HL52_9BACT|nr:hypothetical protein [Spirosoma liriopis]MCK8492883.1 hypothetical protein [Spirosoma liriopis]
MRKIEFGSKTYQVAEKWSELTPEQYIQLIMCPRLKADGSYETLDNEAAACRAWLGMSPKVWVKLELAHWQWGQLRQQFNWLFTTRPEGKPPINSFAHKGVNYHLPADAYGDTSAVELSFANMAYLEFANPEEPTPDALDRLIAILCRPRRADFKKFRNSAEWNGDLREPFNESRMVDRAKDLAGLDLSMKLVVLDYFERMNNQFLESYGELFGADKQPRYGDGRGWIMILKNVAKDGHFGDFDKVCQTPAHLLFATMLDDLLDAQDREEEALKNQPK